MENQKTKKVRNYLRVSEKFYSIQGEGLTSGVPAIFLRLGGCNLLCKSDSWTCDTIDVWSKSKRVVFDFVFTETEIKHLKDGAHLVITGGEPLLHQKSIEDFLCSFFISNSFLPTIEIETNGTITPTEYLVKNVDYFNVSPKLSNSGEPYSKRYKADPLFFFNHCSKTVWKFVISSDKDLIEFKDDFDFIRNDERLFFMPAGHDLESINKTSQLVIEACKNHNVRFSPRLQIYIYNQATGV